MSTYATSPGRSVLGSPATSRQAGRTAGLLALQVVTEVRASLRSPEFAVGAVIIPVILMFRAVGLSGSYTGIILLYTAFNLAFTIWMMKSFFDELSLDVEDAARIDGSSDMKVFFKICLPQVVAGLAATFVFGLILTWNEFLFALLLSGPDTRTVPVAMNQAVSSGGRGTDWTLLAAIETLFLIPVFLVTFFLQNHLLRGVTFGTVKR